MNQDEELSDISALESNEEHDDDYNEFKEAILNDTYSDEFNLTEKDLAKLTSDEIDVLILNILNTVFIENELIPLSEIRRDTFNRLELYSNFRALYSTYLGRYLENGESNVLDTAIKIILWRVYGKTFKNICWYRYSYASKSHEREALERLGRNTATLDAMFITGYHDIPNKNLNVFSLFPIGTRAKDIDYDLIMYDTYDYIDKLIGFKLSDVFYAAFLKFYEKHQDSRALKLSKFIKYGTDDERHIWMLRYGMSFEDIEILESHIVSIDSKEIIFKDTINALTDEEKASILRYIN